MKMITNIREIISNDSQINCNYYENDNYLGLIVSRPDLFPIIKFLKNNKNLLFDQLIDLTAVDYPSRELRFELVYLLLSLKLNKRIIVKIHIDENNNVESISNIHKSANWYERECYDLFGIQFLNHPDLRRIMTDYNFEGHPLRKDFPLTGHNEVRYDDLEKKVIYEDVKLTQEYRDFDYASPWEGFENTLIGDEKASDKKK